MIVMTSMELDDDQSYDAAMPIPMQDKPRFPYGLAICLTQDEFDKLGLDPVEAVIGGMVHLHAMARITSVRMSQDEGGDSCRVELQIENLAVESEDEENAEADAIMPARKSIYSKPMA